MKLNGALIRPEEALWSSHFRSAVVMWYCRVFIVMGWCLSRTGILVMALFSKVEMLCSSKKVAPFFALSWFCGATVSQIKKNSFYNGFLPTNFPSLQNGDVLVGRTFEVSYPPQFPWSFLGSWDEFVPSSMVSSFSSPLHLLHAGFLCLHLLLSKCWIWKHDLDC